MSKDTGDEKGHAHAPDHSATGGCDSEFCKDVHRRLHAFLDGECDPDERRFLDEHIHECPQCLEEFGSEQAIRQLLRRCCQQSAPAELRRRITTRIRVSYTSVDYRRG
ncbi:mycothiol system anti-sigma-R factor [Corynebacterium lactis]|uniref:mycothiol system anti-sigma-R factor n=1 Tax=Corynebacterium lactis TaxID=1231000 RepID=UPI0006A95C95|nr:mycothiol system anti-sigma-R factor [Corynebacterium lactis]